MFGWLKKKPKTATPHVMGIMEAEQIVYLFDKQYPIKSWPWLCDASELCREELLEHNVLAEVILAAARKSFILTVCSLYARDSRSITVIRFNAYLESIGKPDQNWVQQWDTAVPLIRRLDVIRNKYYAHVSAERFDNDFLMTVDLRYKEFTHAAEVTWNLIEGLSTRYGRGYLVYQRDPRSDLRRLFPKFIDAPWG